MAVDAYSISQGFAWLGEALFGALPGECLICGDSADGALCTHCACHYWSAEQSIPRCVQCGVRIGKRIDLGSDIDLGKSKRPYSHGQCGRCLQSRYAFDRTLALADYRPPLDILAITLKFRNRPALASDLAARLARLLQREGQAKDPPRLLLPVPLSNRRLAERGYNQAWELTRRIGHRLGIASESRVLVRKRSAAQASLSLAARQRNMQDAIAVSAASTGKIRGAHIGVIDDVMTTGATFDAVARVLKAAGARKVTNLVVFRTA